MYNVEMRHYYWKDKKTGEIVVQNAVMGYMGQEHRHTPKDFKRWIKEGNVKKENLRNMDKQPAI